MMYISDNAILEMLNMYNKAGYHCQNSFRSVLEKYLNKIINC